MYSITYNNITSADAGCEIVSRPHIPSAERNIEEQAVPGRNGSLFFDYGTYKSIQIDIALNFKAKPEEWHQKLSQIKKWLNSDGNKILRLSDMPGEFYRVYTVKAGQAERSSKEVGTMTVAFICQPFKYTDEGEALRNNPDILTNTEDIEANPIYYIEGEGNCTLSINGNIMTASVNTQGLILDVERELAYTLSGELKNASVSGEYEALRLSPGVNTINISQGFTLKVKPRWRRL